MSTEEWQTLEEMEGAWAGQSRAGFQACTAVTAAVSDGRETHANCRLFDSDWSRSKKAEIVCRSYLSDFSQFVQSAIKMDGSPPPTKQFKMASSSSSSSGRTPFSGLSLASSPPAKISLGSGLKMASSAQQQRGIGGTTSATDTKSVKKLVIKNAKSAPPMAILAWKIGGN